MQAAFRYLSGSNVNQVPQLALHISVLTGTFTVVLGTKPQGAWGGRCEKFVLTLIVLKVHSINPVCCPLPFFEQMSEPFHFFSPGWACPDLQVGFGWRASSVGEESVCH